MEQSRHSHELDSISCIEKCSRGLLVGGSIGASKYLSYFRMAKEVVRQVSKRQPTLLKWVASGRVVVAYETDLKVISLDEENLKLVDLTTVDLSVRCSSLTANHRLNKLLIVDPFKCILLLDCELNGVVTAKPTLVASATCQRLCNDVAFLGELMVACDKKGGLRALLPWLNAPNDLEKMELYAVGSISVHEDIWTLVEEGGQSLLYGTAEGSIGRLRTVDRQAFGILKQVEGLARQVVPFLTDDYFNANPRLSQGRQ